MLKVLMLANHFVGHGGGSERIADDLAQYLASQELFAVTLAANGKPPVDRAYSTFSIRGSTLAERLTGLPLLMPMPQDLVAIRKAVLDCDAVVLHDNLYLTHLLVQLIANRRRIPVLLIKHTGWVYSRTAVQAAAQRLIQRHVVGPSLNAATRLVAVTEAKREALRQLVGAKHIEVIGNGIDTKFFTPDGGKRDIDVLFVGRFVEKKGIGLVKELARKLPDVNFLCVGFGPIDPRNWDLANVRVLLRPNLEKIRDAYQRAKVTILPCVSEGTPLVVAESLACGTPVIVSDHAAHPHLPAAAVLPVDLSWPTPVVESWQAAILHQLSQGIDAAALHGAASRAFSFETMGERYAHLIRQMISEPAGPHP